MNIFGSTHTVGLAYDPNIFEVGFFVVTFGGGLLSPVVATEALERAASVKVILS